MFAVCLAALVHAQVVGADLTGLEFSRTTVDVGEVRCGAPLGHRFLFINRGKAPVEIVDVKPACGCMTPKLSKKVLQPGEDGQIVLEVNTLSQASGPQDWWVKLTYQAAGQVEETTLHVTGRLITEISVDPASMVIYADQTIDQVMTVTDTRSQPLTIKGVSATSAYLETQVGTAVRNKDGQWAIPIQLRFNGAVADGRHQDTISICTSDPAYPELRVPVTVVKETQSKVTAAPEFVSMRGSADQAVLTKIIVLRNSGDVPVDVEKIAAEDPAVHCTWAQGPDNDATIKLTIDRRQMRGDHLLDTLRIQLRKPSEQVVTVPVEVIGH
jgi:hypothetical protein